MTTPADRGAAAPSIATRDDGLVIDWGDGSSNFYHYFWLRSACYCEHCGDTASGARRLQPGDVAPNVAPRSCVVDGDHLEVHWAPDGHVSRYGCEWLREHAYDVGGNRRRWQPRLWNANQSLDELSHDYASLRDDPGRYFDFLRCLRDFGVALVRRRAAEAVGIERMTSLIGDIANAAYDPVFEIKPQPVERTYGNSTQTIPPHTDEAYLHTPTGILVLYCIRPARDGGESILVDGFELCRQLQAEDPRAYEILATCPQAYHRVVPQAGLDYRTRARALSVDENGDLVGFRFHARAMAPSDVDGERAHRLHAANHRLSQLMMQPDNQLCFKLDAGDAVFFDNHRVMHSRRAFNDPERHLQICNVAREQFHQRVRLTAAERGHRDEAGQYLPAGVSG